MHKYFKIFITFSLLIGAIFAFKARAVNWAIFLFFISGLPIFLFFQNEYLLLGFLRMRQQDFTGLEKWLKYIKHPKSQLIKRQQAYYYFLYGILTTQSNMIASEKYMKKALEIGLTFQHYRAIAKLNLVASAIRQGRKREAEFLLTKVKKLNHAGMLDEYIKIMQHHIKHAHVGRNLRTPCMR